MTAEPRTARGRATRDRVLAAATGLVAEHGVAATSLEDICRIAECSKSQLYLYFEDRGDLLRAVAQHTSDQVVDLQAAALGACDTPAGIAAYLDLIVALQTERDARGGCPLGSLAGQLAEVDDRAREELAVGLSRWQSGLRAGLASMAARDELIAETDVDALATQMLSLIQGGLILTQVHRDLHQIRLAADGALTLLHAAQA